VCAVDQVTAAGFRVFNDLAANGKELGKAMKKRTVLITGGSNGIGRATVERFARGGDRVWFTYRLGLDRARELVGQLAAEGIGQVDALEFDQGNWESHRALIEQLPEPVDVLINNAAVGSTTVKHYAPADEQAQDQAMFRVNSIGPPGCCTVPCLMPRWASAFILAC
jgi:NAD(P)-dependent dehydrogenase (short-subunit alcohol dehydrogenase family)